MVFEFKKKTVDLSCVKKIKTIKGSKLRTNVRLKNHRYFTLDIFYLPTKFHLSE